MLDCRIPPAPPPQTRQAVGGRAHIGKRSTLARPGMQMQQLCSSSNLSTGSSSSTGLRGGGGEIKVLVGVRMGLNF